MEFLLQSDHFLPLNYGCGSVPSVLPLNCSCGSVHHKPRIKEQIMFIHLASIGFANRNVTCIGPGCSFWMLTGWFPTSWHLNSGSLDHHFHSESLLFAIFLIITAWWFESKNMCSSSQPIVPSAGLKTWLSSLRWEEDSSCSWSSWILRFPIL